MLEFKKSVDYIKANIPSPVTMEDVNKGLREGTRRPSPLMLFLPGPIPGRVMARVENRYVQIAHPSIARAPDIFLDGKQLVSALDLHVDGDEIGPLDFCIGLTETKRNTKSGKEIQTNCGYVVAEYRVFSVLHPEGQHQSPDLVNLKSMSQDNAISVVNFARDAVDLSLQRQRNS